MTPCVVEKNEFLLDMSLHRPIRVGFFSKIIDFLKYISFKLLNFLKDKH